MEDYINILNKLLNHTEHEVVEFKHAKDNYSFEDMGKYFSALSNEANLRGLKRAWLVFGIKDKTHVILGTNYRNSESALQKLKHDIAQHTTDGITFRNIVPLFIEGKRVLLFEIPAAPRNMKVCWKNFAYGRDGESLVALNTEKTDEIRYQAPRPDWSAELVEDGNLEDLDELALATARIMFKKVHASNIPANEVDSWTTDQFLIHSEMMRKGKLTRSAILLLGKPTSLQKIQPVEARISWVWKNNSGDILDYEHFTVPFILSVEKIFGRIRNKTMRELPGGTLFPDTMKQYEDYSIREALHNCIAHQDYNLNKRITLVETENALIYTNGGDFIPKSVENVLREESPQTYYRNTNLCHGMHHFNMIDTVGRGIPKMFSEQRRRFFPMPEYDINKENNTVSVTLIGVGSDDAYMDLLKSDSSLTLMECLWLDAIRGHKTVSKEAIKRLRERKLIEGRAPHFHIALNLAKKTNLIGHYTKETGLNHNAISKWILQLGLNAYPDGFKRKDVFEIVETSLPISLSKKQKLDYISNTLRLLQRKGFLSKTANGRGWIITDQGKKEIT